MLCVSSKGDLLPTFLAACLIDEMYLECHPGDGVGDIGKGRTYEECITMMVALRGMGVAAHVWL